MKRRLLKVENRKTSFLIMSILIVILLWASSVAGLTYAWFTSGTDYLVNVFKVGNLDIEVNELEPDDPQTAVTIEPGECNDFMFEIENAGSKTAYIRAKFDGYWKRDYHYNQATAIATASSVYNDEIISSSSEAYFKYDYSGFEPDVELGDTSGFIGFYDSELLGPFSSETIPVSMDNINTNGNANDGSQEPVLPDCNDDEEHPRVTPLSKTSSENLPEYDKYFYQPGKELPDKEDYGQENLSESNLIYNLYKPDHCQLKSIKLKDHDSGDDLSSDNIGENVYSYTHDDGFQIKVEKREVEIEGEKLETFAFASNYPVYHVFAKGGGGRVGGNLYRYYNPGSGEHIETGVKDDCGLKQPGGGWSHITIFYCEPKDPGLDINKQVKDVDGNWLDAGSLEDAPLIPADKDNPPEFRFRVENTGDVDLTVDIEDTALGVIGNNIDLSAGETKTLTRVFPDWKDHLDLSTENVTIELCADMDNQWVPPEGQPLGTYFYHTQPVKDDDQVPLCINVCLDGVDEKYQGAYLTIYPYFEAVQASHPKDMVEHNWPVTIDESGELSLINE